MVEPTKGEIRHAMNVTEKDVQALLVIEDDLKDLQKRVDSVAGLDGKGPMRDPFNQRGILAKVNKSVKSVGEVIGGLSACIRDLKRDEEHANPGLYDGQKPGATQADKASSSKPPATKKPTAKKTTAAKKKTGGSSKPPKKTAKRV